MDTRILDYRIDRRITRLYWNRRGGGGNRAHSLRDIPHIVPGYAHYAAGQGVEGRIYKVKHYE